MPKLSGNKGEWSEIYVFLRALAVGKLYAADENLNKVDDVFYNIINIVRNENIGVLEFRVDKVTNMITVYNTMALENDIDIKTLSTMIGHISAETTLNIYNSHITDTMQQQASVRIDREIGGTDAQMPEPKPTKASEPAPTKATPEKEFIRQDTRGMRGKARRASENLKSGLCRRMKKNKRRTHNAQRGDHIFRHSRNGSPIKICIGGNK